MQDACSLLLPVVVSSVDASRLVILDEVGPVDAGDHGRGTGQLAWSDGFSWVGHQEVIQVIYRAKAKRYCYTRGACVCSYLSVLRVSGPCF